MLPLTPSSQLCLCPSTQRTFHLYGQTRSSVHRKALCQLLSSYTGMTKMLVWVFPVRWYKTRQTFWPTLPFPVWPSDDPPAGRSESCCWLPLTEHPQAAADTRSVAITPFNQPEKLTWMRITVLTRTRHPFFSITFNSAKANHKISFFCVNHQSFIG